ncbi:MAG: AmiS/UreI family transporter [Alicyclobacillus herbarius]|nr:AmiS/UreI family transporter [Alicyclobacillus herbarius]MCL6631104.1 AmiS/UreI family transporter [Alicyclobacillus herbarius]
MSNVGLMYVGAVLFINALMLLNKVDSKSAGVFNLFVGSLQVLTPIYIIFSTQDSWTIWSASGIFLFGFTYLYVGLTNLCKLSTTGLGWYCLWVCILAIGYSIVNFVHLHDLKFGIIWMLWSFLWGLFYLLLAQNRDIALFTGWVTFIEAWVTCTIPAFLSMGGLWKAMGPTLVWISTAIIIVSFAVVFIRTHSPSGRHPTASAP